MAEKTMTQKEMFNHIIEVCGGDAEIVAFCEKKIEQLNRPRKKKSNAAAAAFRDEVVARMSEMGVPTTNKELAADMEVSAQKMSAALRVLVAEGRVNRIEGEAKSDPATFELA